MVWHAWTHRRAVLRVGLVILAILLVFGVLHVTSTPPESPFRIDPQDWSNGGPKPLEHMPNFPFELSPVKKRGMVVPNVMHYIFLSKTSEPTRMSYWQYLSIRSSLTVQRPHRVYIHCDYLPIGPWWDLLEPEVVVNKVVAPEKVWGQAIALPAHKSDILRLLALEELGGIYLDLDIFVTRPFDDLMYNSFSMGLQGALDGKYRLSEGLGNGVVVSAPHAPFLDRWLTSYQQFHGEWYNYNGVRKPWEIAQSHASEIEVLNGYAFFYPHFDENERIYTKDDFDWNNHTGYTYHAWNSLAWKWLNVLTPFDVIETDTSFHRLMRRFMGPRDREVWLEDLKAKEGPQ